jgi:hypothetical protein
MLCADKFFAFSGKSFYQIRAELEIRSADSISGLALSSGPDKFKSLNIAFVNNYIRNGVFVSEIAFFCDFIKNA